MIGSVLTTPSSVLTRRPRVLVPGPPKQFAAFCGMMMSAIGGGLYFGQAKGFYIGGAVVLAILAALATLEGALNFCMGCWMFSMAQRFSTSA